MDYISKEQRIMEDVFDFLHYCQVYNIVKGDKSVTYIGGVELAEDDIAVRRDFFKEPEYPLFRDDSGAFVTTGVEFDTENTCVTIHRLDGDVKVYCSGIYIPVDFDYLFEDNNPSHDVFALFDKRIQDNASTKDIDDVTYTVYDPSWFDSSQVPCFLRDEYVDIFNADQMLDKLLKVYFAANHDKAEFAFGLWDVEEDCPLTDSAIRMASHDYLPL